MRCLVLAVLYLLGIGQGQWLEQVVELRGDEYPWKACYNTVSDKVYFANRGRNNVVIVDGASNEVIARVQVRYSPHALCFNPTENKVYCAYMNGVLVIDGVSNLARARISVGPDNMALCCHTSRNKVYADGGEDIIEVIDGAGDSVIGAVRCGDDTYHMLLVPEHDQLWCSGYDLNHGLTVVDCGADRVVATVRPGRYPGRLVYSRETDRVCVACEDVIVSVDCSSFRVDTLSEEDVFLLGAAPGRGKLYYGSGSTTYVYDLFGDSLVGEIPNPASRARAVLYDSTRNRMYTAGFLYAQVIDCVADTVVAAFDFGSGTRIETGAWSSRYSRAYLGDHSRNAIVVLRDTSAAGVSDGAGGWSVPGRPGKSVFRAAELAGMDCRVTDIRGRDVTDERGRLVPGVYFLKDEGGRRNDELDGRAVVRKVVVQR